MEREPEEPLLAAELDVAADVEQDGAPAAAEPDHASRLLDDVARAGLAGRVREKHRRVEASREDVAAGARLPALPRREIAPAIATADPTTIATTARPESPSAKLGRKRTEATVVEGPRRAGAKYASRSVRIFVIGAGQVGFAIVEALHDEHDITVLDTEVSRLSALAGRYDVATYEGDGTSRRDLATAGIKDADLVIACTSRDEVNLVAGMFARREARNATTVIRTSNVEYVELWREGQLDVDFVVSSELETAHAISRIIGVPAARQTDVFAEGQVQLVEFDVEEGASPDVVGVPLRDARFPRDSKVAAIIRGDEMLLPGGDDRIAAGRPDRRPRLARRPRRRGARCSRPASRRCGTSSSSAPDASGRAIARLLLEQGMSVRIIEASRERARRVAESLPEARVYNATGIEPDFLERERIGHAHAAIFAMRDDAKNLYAAVARRRCTASSSRSASRTRPSRSRRSSSAGIDVSVNPRGVTAEEIIRFAHDPRTKQVALLEGNRYEVIDVTLKDTSEYIGKRFKEMPIRGALIGAVVRNGDAIFPHRDDVLAVGRPRDRLHARPPTPTAS